MISVFRRLLILHGIAALACVAVTAFLFRLPVFYGYRFIGNSDRWNHYLSFARFHADNLVLGHFSAWSEHLFSGFDTLSLPFSFVSPLFVLPAVLGITDVIRVLGYVGPILLAMTLILAYAVLYRMCHDRLAATAGAMIYGLSTHSLLRLSQNDGTFLTIVLVPLFFHLVHTATPVNAGRRLIALTALVWAAIHFAFLQELSYVVLFLVCYGAYRWVRGDRAPLLVHAVSMVLGVVLAAPRLIRLAEMVGASTRSRGKGLPEFVGPQLFLRYLDADILGRSSSEVWGQQPINLSEGNLLHAAAFASFLLIVIVVCRRGRYVADGDRGSRVRYGFFVGFIVCVFCVMHVPPVYRLFTHLYADVSFLHSRFGVAALFPIAVVSSLYLTRSDDWRATPALLAGIALIAASAFAIDTLSFDRLTSAAGAVLGYTSPLLLRLPPLRVTLVLPELVRTLTLGVAFITLCSARGMRLISADLFRTIIAVIIFQQAVVAGERFTNGPHTRRYTVPFERHDSVMAPPGEFRPPTAEELRRLHARLANEQYRSVLVCPPSVTAAECSSGLGLTWRMRLADGYLSGVPGRYARLPWPPHVSGFRALRFDRAPSDAAWKILSFLNVRQAVVVDRELYVATDPAVAERITLVPNPSPYIVPRAYFAAGVRSASPGEVAAAVRQLLSPCPRDQQDCSPLLAAKPAIDWVEGPVNGMFEPGGDLEASFDGDRIELRFPAASAPRFLVVNERWDPHWEADADGRRLPVYPTNLVMRGMPVPAGATGITLRYRTVLGDTVRYLAVAVPLLMGAALLARRHGASVVRRIIGPQPATSAASPQIGRS
jgi:hypothetical protein